MQHNRDMPLGQWFVMFNEIYSPTQNYGRPTAELFVDFIRVVGGQSATLVRFPNEVKAKEYLAKTFAWFAALMNATRINVEAAVWQKYPAACPRCLSATCQCPAQPNEIDWEALKDLQVANSPRKPRTLREWQRLFGTIYRGPSGAVEVPYSRERIDTIFRRLIEEIGEFAAGLARDERVDAEARDIIVNEAADVFAWLMSLANNFHLVDPSFTSVELADVVWSAFPNRCDRCGHKPCHCPKGAYRDELAAKGVTAPLHWDELTGVANLAGLRRYMENAEREYRDPDGMKIWSIIFFDLDHFGRVNKERSHVTGDRLLRAVAQRAAEIVGTRGIVFRRGGEEFTAVLRGLGGPGAMTLAEALRAGIASVSVPDDKGDPVAVTVSLGVASSTDVHLQTKSSSPSNLDLEAERLARLAKQGGRDRVVGLASEAQ